MYDIYMCEIPSWTINTWIHPWTINTHLKNEGQEGKRGPILGWVPVEGRRLMERVKKGKYIEGILYSCVTIEQWNLMGLF
jgi:hypothetical protein